MVSVNICDNYNNDLYALIDLPNNCQIYCSYDNLVESLTIKDIDNLSNSVSHDISLNPIIDLRYDHKSNNILLNVDGPDGMVYMSMNIGITFNEYKNLISSIA